MRWAKGRGGWHSLLSATGASRGGGTQPHGRVGERGEIGGNNIFSTIELVAKSEVIEIVLVEISLKI